MPKTKAGEVISWKEFFKRWGEGIEGITPLQKLQAQMNGIIIQLIGLNLGFVITILNFKTLWWVSIILFGGIIVSGIQHLGVKQQINNLKKFESETEEQTLDELFKEDGSERPKLS